MNDSQKPAGKVKTVYFGGGKVIPTTTGRGKHLDTNTNANTKKWGKAKATIISVKMKSLHNIMPNISKKPNQAVNSEKQVEKKSGWVPVLNTIPTIEGSGNTRQQDKLLPVKFEMDRSNLKVVEGSASSIQLNLEKSKGLAVGKTKRSQIPKEESGAPIPGSAVKPGSTATPGHAANTPQPSPVASNSVPPAQQMSQTPAFQGRMTASSFMKQAAMKQPVLNTPWPPNPYTQSPNSLQRVTGIPRTFLTAKHQQQIQDTPQQKKQQQQKSSADGPIWEDVKQTSWEHAQSSQLYNHGGQTFGQSDSSYDQSGQTFRQGGQGFGQNPVDQGGYGEQIFVDTNSAIENPKQQYSPSDPYGDISINDGSNEDRGGSPDSQQSGSKRLSAFKRLGPVTQPKKPKLTINLLFNKEQAVREVVDQSDEAEVYKYMPAHLKPEIQTSLDDTVMKYLVFWPWKKPVPVRRTLTVRSTKSVMMMDLEQVEEQYDRDSSFFQVSVTGYPASWSKEDVIDAVLESIQGKSFIPCFIEFSKTECKFLVIRSRGALTAIHKLGFIIRKHDVELTLSIMVLSLSVNQIDFIPRLVLRKRLSNAMEGETEINLKQFTTTSDASHFIYFPLNRVANQNELMRLQSSVPWEFLTKLILSHNRITSLSGFDLPHYTPHLRHLDISHNHISGVSALLPCRGLPLSILMLEGNPLCTDYTDPQRYTKVLKMIFSGLKEIDGVEIPPFGSIPAFVRNHCEGSAAHVAAKVLEVLFPLLDAPRDQRKMCEELYDVNAVMTLTYMYKLRYGPIYKDYRTLFFRARIMDEGEMDSIEGAAAIAKLVDRWPILQHDPMTFTVDVMYHTDTTTILRVSGIVKITAETLAEDEHLLFFTRTLVLHSIDTVEYKITNEMIYWDLPETERAREAFRMTTIRSKNLSLKLDNPPDEDLKERLLEIFMTITELERKPSERCLESREWHLKNALEYFTKLLKLDNLEPLYSN